MVVVDRFSKGVHFGALPQQFTAFKATTLLLGIICKHHRFPRSFILDHDPIFCKLVLEGTIQIEQHISTDEHGLPSVIRWPDWSHESRSRTIPQIIGSRSTYRMEVLESCLMVIQHFPPFWHREDSLIYSKPLPSIPSYILGSSSIEVVDSILITRKTMHEDLKRHLLKAQETMKQFTDA